MSEQQRFEAIITRLAENDPNLKKWLTDLDLSSNGCDVAELTSALVPARPLLISLSIAGIKGDHRAAELTRRQGVAYLWADAPHRICASRGS